MRPAPAPSPLAWPVLPGYFDAEPEHLAHGVAFLAAPSVDGWLTYRRAIEAERERARSKRKQ